MSVSSTFIFIVSGCIDLRQCPPQEDWEGTADRSYQLVKPGRDSYTCAREQAACTVVGYAIKDVIHRETQCVELVSTVRNQKVLQVGL